MSENALREVPYWAACWANYDEVLRPLARETFDRVVHIFFCTLVGSDWKDAMRCFRRTYRARNIRDSVILLLFQTASFLAANGERPEEIEKTLFTIWYEKMLSRILGDDFIIVPNGDKFRLIYVGR